MKQFKIVSLALCAVLLFTATLAGCFPIEDDGDKTSSKQSENSARDVFNPLSDDDSSSVEESSVDLDELLKGLKVGDTVEFGRFEQDGDSENGKESVEWLVLEIKDNKALLLSLKGLDCQEYHYKGLKENVTWENCSLRNWLNDNFYNAAFDDDEKKIIAESEVTVEQKPGSDTKDHTNDNVFLLSTSEFSSFLLSSDKCVCIATKHAKNVAETTKDKCVKSDGSSRWWLRSPGDPGSKAAVGTSGVLCGDGKGYNVVRPALRIKLPTDDSSGEESSKPDEESSKPVEETSKPVEETSKPVEETSKKYTITYKVDGNFYTEQTYKADDRIIPPEGPKKEGCIFSGWKIPEKMPAENITLDATLKSQEGPTQKLKVGDTVEFGQYDNADILWKILDINGGEALLISADGIACRPYNDEDYGVDWENCSLRKWLNDSFYNAAFDGSEKKAIVESTVTADENPDYSTYTSPGTDTKDYVYILSVKEARKYFEEDNKRKCLYRAEDVCWWLRTPGNFRGSAARVLQDGRINSYGYYVFGAGVVRPVLRINLSEFANLKIVG